MARDNSAAAAAAGRRAPQAPTSNSNSNLRLLLPAWKSYLLLLLAACWSPVSQLTLSPTHGSIPAALHHSQLTTSLLLLTIPLDGALKQRLPFGLKKALLPLLAFCVPIVQRYLIPRTFAELGLGPERSALAVESLTYAPIAILTLNLVSPRFAAFAPAGSPGLVRRAVPPLLAAAFFYSFEGYILGRLPALFGSSALFSRAFSPLVLALATAVLLPSKYLLFAAVPFLHTVTLDTHTPGLPWTEGRLDSTLVAVNATLLARKEGPTGYISVVQKEEVGFRVMRCDHSLLGGEWVFGVGGWAGGSGYEGRRGAVGEPVYTVFLMLEAIRLVQDAEPRQSAKDDAVWAAAKSPLVPDEHARALVIGLGIGTTPAALVAHGVDTTVVEIDPVVFEYAREFFGLPSKGMTSVVQDAAAYVREASDAKYDYIVHDVFTGGAEPAELFTAEFVRNLKRRLSEDGVVAINYAGDLLQAPAGVIARTILSVFGTCRIFREDEPPKEGDELDIDFTNIIFFCRRGNRPFVFRDPVDSDFLGTMSRRTGLLPVYEVDPAAFAFKGESESVAEVLSEKNIDVLDRWRAPGAIGHWKVMRTVLPAAVWENW